MTPKLDSVPTDEENISNRVGENSDHIADAVQSTTGLDTKNASTLEYDSETRTDGISEDVCVTPEEVSYCSDGNDTTICEGDTTCAHESTEEDDKTGNEMDSNVNECEESVEKVDSTTRVESSVERNSRTENDADVAENENDDNPRIPDEDESNGRAVSSSIELKPASEVVQDSNAEPECDSRVTTSSTSSETSDYYSSSDRFSPPTNEDSMHSSSSVSEDYTLADLPQEMIEEERKFARQTEQDLKATYVAPLVDAERERRYKTMMSLLGKSKEYASYMSQKLTSKKEVLKEATPVLQNATNHTGTGRKRKSGDRVDGSSTPKKAKTDPAEQQTYDPETHYKNSMDLIVSRRQPRLLSGGVMRDYQLDGLEWMVALYANCVNGILADEMGLGKTIQTISLLCHLRERGVYGPHLIIGPLSTLPNWLAEFANFAPEIPVALFHGPEEKRNAVIERFVSIMAKKDRPNLPIIITSYEMPLRDKKFLSMIKWRSIIVDEGHRLKNYQTMLARELRRYKTEYRLLLTGTPLQNNLTELWSLLNYLIPEIFDNLESFENLFDFSDLRSAQKQNELLQKEKEEQLISKMHQILEPFLLRRVKAEVDIALPRKKEIVVKAPMTPEQETLYKSVVDKSIAQKRFAEEEKDEEEPPEGRRRRSCARNKKYSEDWNVTDETEDLVPSMIALPSSRTRQRVTSADGTLEYVFNVKLTSPHMMLRKIANHPYLVKTPVYPGTRDIVVDENLITQSGKLLVLDALLPRLKAGGHKVLLFSAFKILLDLIEDYVIMRQHKYVRFDGDTDIEDRLTYIKQFNSEPDTFIFLITTRAGGLGVNLTGADTVIIYDSDWNPQVDLQAQDRCHRIGQTRPVVVYRLLTAGTVDEYIMNTAVNKRRLEKLVVQKGKFNQGASESKLDLTELKALMESTDYKQVIHPNGLVLSDEEIEHLLDRSDLVDECALGPATPSASKTDEKNSRSRATPRRQSKK